MGESPTRGDAPAGSNRSNCGGNETVEASGDPRVTKYGDVASVQAVTRGNAEQVSKRTMRGPTRPRFRGRLTWLGEQEQKHLYGYFGLVRLTALGSDQPWAKA